MKEVRTRWRRDSSTSCRQQRGLHGITQPSCGHHVPLTHRGAELLADPRHFLLAHSGACLPAIGRGLSLRGPQAIRCVVPPRV